MTTAHLHVTLPKLRPLQRELYLNMRRWNVWVCHRRFGKTVLTLCITLKKALDHPLAAPRYAYVAPLYRQAKSIVWDYCRRLAGQIPGTKLNEAELRLDMPNGARLQLLGADNPDSLRGMYLDGVILDEYAQMAPRAWTQVIRPALSDRAGWCIKIGTPYGRNHFFYDWREAGQQGDDSDYHAALYRASETGILSAAELASARATMRSTYGELAGDADYEQEFECAWEAAIPGAYYSQEFLLVDKERRVSRCPYDPSYPVYTFWDLGVDDATAIWCVQFIGRQICLLHYYENSGYGAPHYAEYLSTLPYRYRAHILPHDGHNRDWGSGEHRDETLERLVQGEVHVAQRPGLETSIANVRLVFPRLLFDESGCEKGIDTLRNYHHEWDADKRVFKSTPAHDWASHGADALRTLAVSLSLVEQIEDRYRGQESPPVPQPQPFSWRGAATSWMGH